MNEENSERNRLEFLLNKSPDGREKRGLEGEVVYSLSNHTRATQAVQILLAHGAKRGSDIEATLIVDTYTGELRIKDQFGSALLLAVSPLLWWKTAEEDRKKILKLIESLKKEKGFEPSK